MSERTMGGATYHFCRNNRNSIGNIIRSTFLCLKYPFLKFPYSRKCLIQKSCWYYHVMDGWRYMFLQMCDEIRMNLKAYGIPLSDFRIFSIYERDGSLSISSTEPGDVGKILEKYEYISYRTCIECGKPAVGVANGYAPFCNDCKKARQMDEFYRPDNTWYGYYKFEDIA